MEAETDRPLGTEQSEDTAREQLRAKTRTMREDVRELGRLGREAANETIDDARRAAGDWVDHGRRRAGDVEDQLVQYVRDKPVKSLLIATGVGALLGMIWSRR